MSSIKYLREFVNERLAAAADDIIGVFEKTIVFYEEEIDRQRRLLDIVWKPEIKLHRMESPQQPVFEEREALSDPQQLCIEESLDQEEPDAIEIKEEKEEEEELCTEIEQLVVKQETDAFLLTPTHEESDLSENQTPNMIMVKESYMSVENSVASVPHSDHQYICLSSGEPQTGSTRDAEQHARTRRHRSRNRRYDINDYNLSIQPEIRRNTRSGQKFLCDTCGRDFKYNSHYQRHMRTHTGERPYSCRLCEKVFTRRDILTVHMRTHTDKIYSCKADGSVFTKMVNWQTT
ncbi:zinc finger protein 892-like [Centropristis striata]|uniref:zinc finger protein 892-like n=1 Tax=Centropristis striata TaxID=184440 RepID=UPI0027E0BA03|nr:zinc finger protein 892-like [Centropristis striata]